MTASFNPADTNSRLTLSNSDRTVTLASGTDEVFTRGYTGRSSGKYYFEVYLNNLVLSIDTHIGIMDLSDPATTIGAGPGSAVKADGFGYRCNGNKRAYSVIASYTAAVVTGGYVTVYVDIDVGLMWIARNGVYVGDPREGITEMFVIPPGLTYYPAVSTGSVGTSMTGRFTAAEMQQAAPGFTPWDDSNIQSVEALASDVSGDSLFTPKFSMSNLQLPFGVRQFQEMPTGGAATARTRSYSNN